MNTTKSITRKAVNEKQGMSYTLLIMRLLLAEKDFHRIKSTEYLRMFNELSPETDPLMQTAKNSPLQEYAQRRAEHHATNMLLIDSKIEELANAVYETDFIN